MLVETNGEVTSPMLDGNDKQIFQIVIPKVSFRDVSSNRRCLNQAQLVMEFETSDDYCNDGI